MNIALTLLIATSLASQSLAWHFPWKKGQPHADAFTKIVLGALIESPADKWRTGGVPYLDYFPTKPDTPKPEAKQEALQEAKDNRYRIRLSKNDGSLNNNSPVDNIRIDMTIRRYADFPVIVKWTIDLKEPLTNTQLSEQYFKNKDTFHELEIDGFTTCTASKYSLSKENKDVHYIDCQTIFSTSKDFYEKIRAVEQEMSTAKISGQRPTGSS